jgi:hypothetical protein
VIIIRFNFIIILEEKIMLYNGKHHTTLNFEQYKAFEAKCKNFYVEAEDLVGPSTLELYNNTTDISDPDVRDFIDAVGTFFLKKRQREVIERGLF